jgi:hypothetical protein
VYRKNIFFQDKNWLLHHNQLFLLLGVRTSPKPKVRPFCSQLQIIFGIILSLIKPLADGLQFDIIINLFHISI